MFDPHTIRLFSMEVLTLACNNPCSWGNLVAIERTDCSNEYVTRMALRDAHGHAQIIERTEIPVAARVAAQHPRSTMTLKYAVLDQDARHLTPWDAQAIVQQVVYRAIRH